MYSYGVPVQLNLECAKFCGLFVDLWTFCGLFVDQCELVDQCGLFVDLWIFADFSFNFLSPQFFDK